MLADKKILYVEDEEDIRNELVEILGLEFNNILVAANGHEGLELYKEHHPDLIISDIQMPKMDGLSMCKSIKEIDKDANIILMTAFNEESFIASAKDHNIHHYITKPIKINELYDCIESCFKDEDV